MFVIDMHRRQIKLENASDSNAK